MEISDCGADQVSNQYVSISVFCKTIGKELCKIKLLIYLWPTRSVPLTMITHTIYPDVKSLNFLKFKVFVEYKFEVTQTMKFILHRIESRLEKVKDTHYQHCFLFPLCFQGISVEHFNVRIVLQKV